MTNISKLPHPHGQSYTILLLLPLVSMVIEASLYCPLPLQPLFLARMKEIVGNKISALIHGYANGIS